MEKIDIIIPVYNGLEYLPRLFESVFEGTDLAHRLIVVDDASPDKKVWEFLQKVEQDNFEKDILLVQNDVNMGFVRTVNKAVEMTKGHFVLLNTDTEVPKRWLSRLMKPIFERENVASVTPFTNSGTIFSFPEFDKDNEIFEGLSVNEIDKFFQLVDEKENFVELPTGVGFCMAFNKKVVEKIGMFDEESFGKGYGEENDWCQRAIKNGYGNVIAPNLFVYHKHGGSFPSEERKKLIQENFRKLIKKHPNYMKDVEAFSGKDPLRDLRKFLIFCITSKTGSDKPELFFDHEIGGGANLYRDRYIEKRTKEGKKTILCMYDFRKSVYHLKYFYKKFVINYSFAEMSELKELLNYADIDGIVISQLVSYQNIFDVIGDVLEIRKNKSCGLRILVHDYFSVCPNYVLFSDKDKYCEVPASFEECARCMKNNVGEFGRYVENRDVGTWRNVWSSFLDEADEIICFSNASKEILNKAYPELIKEKILVKPHVVDYVEDVYGDKEKKSEEHIVIGVLGGINKIKGSGIVRDIVLLLDKENVDAEVVVIGDFIEKITSNKLKVHGKYNPIDLPKIISKYEVDIFLVPSVWPETFSYTTEEVIQMGYPIAVFEIGAPAERVKKYGKGLVIEKIDARIALDAMVNYCKRNEK